MASDSEIFNAFRAGCDWKRGPFGCKLRADGRACAPDNCLRFKKEKINGKEFFNRNSAGRKQ
jgi:hypothetical protein